MKKPTLHPLFASAARLGLFFAIVNAPRAAQATSPDLSDLTPAQRQVFHSVSQEEYCGCDSSLTLAGCFATRDNCPLAEDLGAIIKSAAAADTTRDDLLLFMSDHVMGPFCKKTLSFNAATAPAMGASAATAKITVVEFADFRCSHCRAAAPHVKRAAGLSANADVRFLFVPYPLNNQPESVLAAEASLAAHAQGKFWRMHDELFALQDKGFTPADIRGAARRSGLNLKAFDTAMAEHTFRPQVDALKQAGSQAGVEATPAFFVNGRVYRFDPAIVTLSTRFKMERHRSQGQCQ